MLQQQHVLIIIIIFCVRNFFYQADLADIQGFGSRHTHTYKKRRWQNVYKLFLIAIESLVFML